jgi:hypothetical protein
MILFFFFINIMVPLETVQPYGGISVHFCPISRPREEDGTGRSAVLSLRGISAHLKHETHNTTRRTTSQSVNPFLSSTFLPKLVVAFSPTTTPQDSAWAASISLRREWSSSILDYCCCVFW